MREPWLLYLTPDGHGFEHWCRECQDDPEPAARIRSAAELGARPYLIVSLLGELRRLELELDPFPVPELVG